MQAYCQQLQAARTEQAKKTTVVKEEGRGEGNPRYYPWARQFGRFSEANVFQRVAIFIHAMR
jgi:hypothetical protein